MRSFRFGLASSLVASMAFVFFFVSIPLEAGAERDECHATCTDGKNNCASAAKAAFRSCKEDCHGAESRRDCRRSCRDALTGARDVCYEAREGCRNACALEPPPPAECEHCRAELRVCLYEVGSGGKSCVRECLSSRRDAARECRSAASPFSCLLGLAESAAQCLSGCGRDISSGSGGCHAARAQCRAACEGGGPYGSVSRAFLAPSVSLLD